MTDLVHLLKAWAAASLAAVVAMGSWLRRHVFTQERLDAVRQSTADLVVAVGRAMGRVRVPSRAEVSGFFSNQVISAAAGWTAGLLSASLVNRWFVRRSARNLWGLAARGDRTVVSGQAYEWLATGTSFVVGLVVLIAVRHMVRGTLAELRELRAQRALTDRPIETAQADAGLISEE